jgi:hypothetical protein
MIPTLQNDQVSTEGLPSFLGGEYNESNESLSANENDVANLPNLKNMHQIQTSPIRHNNWCGNECSLLDLKGVFFARGCVMTSDPEEEIMDNVLGHTRKKFVICD